MKNIFRLEKNGYYTTLGFLLYLVVTALYSVFVFCSILTLITFLEKIGLMNFS